METIGGKVEVRSPFDGLMGTEIIEATADRVVAELPVTPALHQPGGIVHGGVYCALAEVAASVAANIWLAGERVAVGTSNHTDFLRAVRAGRLRAEATPLQRGSRLQLWQIDITDADGRRVAHGKVKLANVADTPGTSDTTTGNAADTPGASDTTTGSSAEPPGGPDAAAGASRAAEG